MRVWRRAGVRGSVRRAGRQGARKEGKWVTYPIIRVYTYTWAHQTKPNRVLDLKPDGIHSRCPIILGSPHDVQRVLDIYAQHSQSQAAPAKVEKVKELA